MNGNAGTKCRNGLRLGLGGVVLSAVLGVVMPVEAQMRGGRVGFGVPARAGGGLGGVRSQPAPFIGSRRPSFIPPVPTTRGSFVPGRSRFPGLAMDRGGRGFTGGGMRFPFDRGSGDRGFFARPGDMVVGPSGVGAIGGSGLRVDGRFRDDDFRLRFHLGAGLDGVPVFSGRHHHRGHFFRHFPFFGSLVYPYLGYGYGYYNYDYPVYSDMSYYDPFLGAQYTATPPPAAPEVPERQLTPLEKAELALMEGRVREAVKLFRKYLATTPEDAEATRMLAVALIQDKQLDQAAAVMILAYEKDPSLASQPIDTGLIDGGRRELRDLVLSAVHYANRVDTSSAWLMVAILMQAEGREETAKKMLQRARERGLEAGLFSKIDAAMVG